MSASLPRSADSHHARHTNRARYRRMVMRIMSRNVIFGAALLAVLLAFGGAVHAQSKCEAGKMKCVIKKKSCLLGLESKALKTGVAPDAAKVAKCKIKFGGSCDAGPNLGLACVQASDCPSGACVKGCFTKLDAKAPTPPDLACPAGSGDAPAFETKVDNFVNDIITDLDPAYPAHPLNLCAGGKVKCVIKKDKCILNIQAKAAKSGLPPDAAKLEKCRAKFGGTCDAGVNLGAPCEVNSECPGGICTGGCFTKLEQGGAACLTTGDAQAEEAKIDAFDADVVCGLDPSNPDCGAPTATPTATGSIPTATPTPGGSCPTSYEFTGSNSGGDVDYGWTGLWHDQHLTSMARLTVAVSNCTNGASPCGQCSAQGPIVNAGGTTFANHRCRGDDAGNNGSWIQCTSDSDCSGTGNGCTFFFGAPQATGGGGVTFCHTNEIQNGAAMGVVNPDTGDAAIQLSLVTKVYSGSGPSIDEPCPGCGAGNTCDFGPRAGQACTVNGSTVLFGNTSFDCPPSTGGLVGTFVIPPTLLTTGMQTITLSAASPNCRAGSHTAEKCFCDTCNNAAAAPCMSNADCTAVGATICGGKRCVGGVNPGA